MRNRLVALTVLAAVLLSGCDGAYDLPLPGGAAGGKDVYRVAVQFDDVMDLVPQSAVKVNDVTVGAVESIELDNWQPVVTVRIENSVRLPDNAVAELRQTSLLGEKFVSLSPPADAKPTGRLGDGDVIPASRTGRTPEVEEVLGALSLLLNGGGVAQLQVINRELNNALQGRESDIKGLLSELDTFVGGLDEQKSQIVRALDELDRLSARLAEQKNDVATVLDQMPEGLKALEDSREQLTQMLTALADLGVVATRVIDASQEDTVANLQALQPVLTRLNEAGDALPKSLELLFTYPFHDGAAAAVRGDYTNLHITLDGDLRSLRNLLPPAPGPTAPGQPAPAPPKLPAVPNLPTVPGLTQLPDVCPTRLLPGAKLPVECQPRQGSKQAGGTGDRTDPSDQGLVGLLLPGGLR
jgi:phospholipid/cholesterol/gamma-HCH transport system substrate-binding protein